MKRFGLLCFIAITCSFAQAVSSFELPWMNNETAGTTYKSTDHATGIFVVEAYFNGCFYCNENAPLVDDLATKYAKQSRVQVLDVGIDTDDSEYQDWISKHNPNHPVLKDANRTLIRQLGTSGYPSTYVIDSNGKVTYKHVGTWDDASTAALEKAIDKLLNAHR